MNISQMQTIDYILSSLGDRSPIFKNGYDLVVKINGELWSGHFIKEVPSYGYLKEIDFTLSGADRITGYDFGSVDQPASGFEQVAEAYGKIITSDGRNATLLGRALLQSKSTLSIFDLCKKELAKLEKENNLPKYLFNAKKLDSSKLELEFLALSDSDQIEWVSIIKGA